MGLRFSSKPDNSNSPLKINNSQLSGGTSLSLGSSLQQDHSRPRDNSLQLSNQDLLISSSQGHRLEHLTRSELQSIQEDISHPNNLNSPRGNKQLSNPGHSQPLSHHPSSCLSLLCLQAENRLELTDN